MADRLRVLLWHWGRRGGGPRYTLELAKALAERDDLEIHLSLSRDSEFFAETDAIGLPGIHIDTYRSLPQFVLRTARIPWIRRRFGRYLADHRIGIVFCTMDHLWDALVASEIRRQGALYLLAVHDATRHPGEDQSVRRWLLRRDIALADGALTLTRSVGQALVANYSFSEKRIWHSALGSFNYGEREACRRLPADRPPRLLFFGRILSYKGLDILLAAMPALQARFPGLTLEVWGTGDIRPYREALASLTGVRIENRWVAEEEIPGIFASTDLAVLSYREASQSAVVATAFADGMPCVATPLPGLMEQVTHDENGIVAAGTGPSDVAEAVSCALGDSDRYERLSAGALRAARTQLDWSPIADTVAAAFHGLQRLGPRQPVEERAPLPDAH